MDSGVEVADADVEETYENPDKIYRTAHEADILFAYSTVEGMVVINYLFTVIILANATPFK